MGVWTCIRDVFALGSYRFEHKLLPSHEHSSGMVKLVTGSVSEDVEVSLDSDADHKVTYTCCVLACLVW